MSWKDLEGLMTLGWSQPPTSDLQVGSHRKTAGARDIRMRAGIYCRCYDS